MKILKSLMLMLALALVLGITGHADLIWMTPLFGLILPAGFPGKAMFDTIQPGGEHAEDVSPLVQILSPLETPLLDFLGIGANPATNIRHEWLEDALIPDQLVLLNNLIADPTDVLVTVADADIFQENEQIQVGKELMMVTHVNSITNQITVTRGYGEDVPMVHASGEDIYLMGEVSIEGDLMPNPQNTTMDRLMNISQIFNYGLAMTGTRQATIPFHLGNIGDEWSYEILKRTKEALRDLEQSVIFGDWNLIANVPQLGSATIRRTMRGIYRHLLYGARNTANVQIPTPANCNVNMAGAQFTFDNFRQWMQAAVYGNGARDASLLLIPPALKLSVSKWKRTAQGIVTPTIPVDQTQLTEIVDVIETDYGRVAVMMVNRLPADVAMLLCPKLVKPLNYTGRSFFIKQMGVYGDLDAKELIGEYTMEMVGVTKGYHCLAQNWIPIP